MEIKALITGGSKGIGYGIARSVMLAGGTAVITSRSLERANEAAERLQKECNSGEVIGLESDVTNFDSTVSAVKKAVDQVGELNVVVANAGIGHFASIEDMTKKQWQETIDTNLTGVFHTIKASLDTLKSTKGFFITISSLAGTNFFAKGSAYNASKFGLTGFTQAIMLDLRKYGIRISTIMPGSVATEFAGHQPDEKDSWKIQIEDIGEMVVNLVNLNPRTLPSKIEVRPTVPPSAK